MTINQLIFFFFINIFASSFFVPKRVRCWIYKVFGISSKSISFEWGCRFSSNRLVVGKSCYINNSVIFDNSATITIGDNVFIGMRCHFITDTHVVGNYKQRAGLNDNRPIIVENGSWIGADSIIMPGVTIKRGCVVAGGSVVIKDTDTNGLYGGNPCRKIKEFTN